MMARAVRRLLLAVSALAVLAGMFFYFWWSSAIRQPLKYSHAQHVKAGLDCASCHTDLESLPGTASCRTCHSAMKLPETVRWIRVYRRAPDILFHHAGHGAAPCAKCHEAFTSAKPWIHEMRFSKPFCMKCHEETGASNDCAVCHKNRR